MSDAGLPQEALQFQIIRLAALEEMAKPVRFDSSAPRHREESEVCQRRCGQNRASSSQRPARAGAVAGYEAPHIFTGKRGFESHWGFGLVV